MEDFAELSQLGRKVEIPSNPREATIECILWDGSGIGQTCCRFTCPEFSSLCPVTGAPDFARIIIDYVPNRHLVESKSLKLYLNSFRNEGAFHEAVIAAIGLRLYTAAQPRWIRVAGLFYARGGIPIDVFWQCGGVSGDVCVPPLEVSAYRGR